MIGIAAEADYQHLLSSAAPCSFAWAWPAGGAGLAILPLRHPRPSPASLGDDFAPDRQPLDVERIRAFRLEHAGQPPPAPCSPFADAKRRDDDIGDAAILFERRGMADERDGLAFILLMQLNRSQLNGLLAATSAASRSTPAGS